MRREMTFMEAWERLSDMRRAHLNGEWDRYVLQDLQHLGLVAAYLGGQGAWLYGRRPVPPSVGRIRAVNGVARSVVRDGLMAEKLACRNARGVRRAAEL